MYKTDKEFNDMISNSQFLTIIDNKQITSSIDEYLYLNSIDNVVIGHMRNGHDITTYSIDLNHIKDDKVLIDFMNIILQEHVFNKYKLSELYIVDKVN